MVRNEADIIAGTLRHMADEVDHMIVADNLSTDGTREILDQLAKTLPLTVVDDREPGYYQAAKMTSLARRASRMGADWIIPFDADEIWYARDGRIRDVLAECSGTVMRVPLFNHYETSIDPRDDDPFRRMVWRKREPGALPKVAFRFDDQIAIHQGNHGVDHPDPVIADSLFEIRHFSYRSENQFVSKALTGAAAYAATDLPPEMGAHWRAYGQIHERFGPDALAQVYRDHFYYRSPTDSDMIQDPAPYLRWQP